MPNVTSAVLCDYAQVREGLLTVVSAGIVRMWRPQLPAPLNVFLALMVEVMPEERAVPHEVSVEVTGPSRQKVAEVRGGFQVGPDPDLDADESQLIPFPLDLRQVGVPEYGWYTFDIRVNSGASQVIRGKMMPTPPQSARPSPRPADHVH